jgi:hypothetical protein
MKYYFEFSIDKASHFLAKRKPNKQVNTVLSEVLPHHTKLVCTQKAFDDFIDVMYALGFNITAIYRFKIGADGRKLAMAPTKHVD